MVIDCDSCEMRDIACEDCVIGVLLGVPAAAEASDGVPLGAPIVQFDAPERRALDVLADQGLIPRLRLVAAPLRRTTRADDAEGVSRHAG